MHRESLLRLAAVVLLTAALAATHPAFAQNPRTGDDATTRFVDVDDTRLAYREYGDGERLLLLERFRGSMDDGIRALCKPWRPIGA